MGVLRAVRLLTPNLHGTKKNTKFFRQLCTATPSEWQKPDENTGHNTGITVYNCVHRGDVPLIVANQRCVTWYTCGPTVYDSAHIGHAVCYMKSDIIQRILRQYFHLNLVTAMNVTDIDDKIIARSLTEKVPWRELANKYENEFWCDIHALGIQKADIVVRVSDSLPQIIEFIQRLLDKKYAYVAADGSVYFVNSRTNAKLKNIETEQSEVRSKLTAASSGVRRSLQDFALWKSAKPNEPKWPVPWKFDGDENVQTDGRPGWHTECATMASVLFGNRIDIHAGGIDLKFPHHENEEAQSCSYHDCKQWVNYWLHIGHLVTTDNVKMSKSLKNVISIQEFLKHYPRDQFRMMCLMSTYRQHIQLDDDTALRAGAVLKHFVTFFDDTQRFLRSDSHNNRIKNRDEISSTIDTTLAEIDAALKKDFDTRACIFSLLELVKVINRSINCKPSPVENTPSTASQGSGLDVIQSGQFIVKRFLEIFGFTDTVSNAFSDKNVASAGAASCINTENLINDIMELRSSILSEAKSSKDQRLFHWGDKVRALLRNNGLIVKDHGGNAKSTWQYDSVVVKKNQPKDS